MHEIALDHIIDNMSHSEKEILKLYSVWNSTHYWGRLIRKRLYTSDYIDSETKRYTYTITPLGIQIQTILDED